jgi:diguanylate cyclase (GGDEF)-like protein/PAS domain S-box-containing protein
MLLKDSKRVSTTHLPNPQQVIVKHLEDRLKYFKALLDHSPDIIVAGNTEGQIVEFNKGAEKLLGYRRDEVVGKKYVRDLYFNPEARNQIMKLVWLHGEVTDSDIQLKTKSGRVRDCSTTMALLKDDTGKVVGTIGIARDISRRKKLERQLEKMAITDGLTKLYDRGYFNQQIYQSVEKAHRFQRSFFLILFDLDGFKRYNDQYGHLAGDEVLRRVGEIVLRSIRYRVDKVFRYGGDEFTVLLAESKHKIVTTIAETIRSQIEYAFGPQITASIGITKLKGDQSSYDFIKIADEAMYQAKASGGNKICSII